MEDPAPHEKVERRLAAILSADAVDYSRLMAADELATLDTLNGHVAVMSGLIRQHGGRVVDAVGDNLLAEFPSAVDAVACAVDVQRHLDTRNAEMPSQRRMLFRIGINLGDLVVTEGKRIAGDGVNVAARLEALAEPGGVTVSGTVFDQVEGKLPLHFEDRGEQKVKNVPKPVRVFRVAVSSAEATGEGQTPAGATELSVPGFAGKHAIAVLPFDNLSGDVEQEYFADGIVEDLITRLSASRIVPVIARNSTFVYKGQAVDVKKVSAELGVRYVVEGSVRKAGNRVRVTAQLIDATTGHHIWAERYDRELHDIFDIQDEITETIVAAVGPELSKAEIHAALRRPEQQLDAWDCVSRAVWHVTRYNREDNEKAQLWARKAIDLNPNAARGHILLATTHLFEIIYRWADPPSRAAADGLRAAEQSVALDPENAAALSVLGFVCTLTQQYERAVDVLSRAIDRGPSSALAYFGLGMALASSGRPDDGIPMLEKAMRLSPRDPWMQEFLFNAGAAHFIAERYEQATEFAKKSLRLRSDQPGVYRLLAASYGMLDRAEEAKAALQELLRLLPDFSDDHVRAFLPEAIAERYLKGLRKAGWRE
jgi:TolB-like protein/cytochrome c-type biogenesis protein CcmH/NrfG